MKTINTVLLKVASRCNLNCTYCFEYNKADQSWRDKPRLIADSVVDTVIGHIKREPEVFTNEFNVVFHGGEPLLTPVTQLDAIAKKFRNAFGESVHFQLMTNGTLLNDAHIGLIKEYHIKTGISFDGPAAANIRRVPLRGNRDTTAATLAGLRLLLKKAPQLFGGCSCVINPAVPPEDIFQFFIDEGVQVMDLHYEYCDHDEYSDDLKNLPEQLKNWILEAAELYFEKGIGLKLKVRLLDAFIEKLTRGKTNNSDFLGGELGTYIIVESDGTYNPLDTLKINQDVDKTCSVFTHSPGQYLNTDIFRKWVDMTSVFPSPCQDCDMVHLCGGYYLPTRYGKNNGYDNESTYCKQLYALSEYVDRSFSKSLLVDSVPG